MCGIAGALNFDDNSRIDPYLVTRMAGTLSHRGPDDEGVYVEGPLGLAFRRLSIIDLAGGHQPMSDSDGNIWVVFNGEIYNFRELRAELQSHGHSFRTHSDTEVLVHGYKQWGEGLFSRLNGMFGVAIWDSRRRRLLLARDPFGIKLVYYRVDCDRLLFGSEIRAISAGADRAPEVDPVGLNLFLRYRYTPSPHTILKGINKLAPGTLLSVEKGQCVIRRWYNYEPVPFPSARKVADVMEELADLYGRALRRHLISDVPVGLLLSGGLDSGLLLALMSRESLGWPTYTVGYGNTYVDDELDDAADTARQFGSIHHEVRIDRGTFEAALPHIVSSLEEPIASSSIVPMYFVCQRASRDVKVALSGQGPDELFGGYTRHLGVAYGRAWRALPGFLRAPLSTAAKAVPRNEALQRGVSAIGIADRLPRYQSVLSLLPGQVIDGLFQNDVLPSGAGDAILDTWSGLLPLMGATDELGGLQFIEMRSTLPDELLMYSDKLSMAHGLELRVPYLDKELVEYVERLPASFKVHLGVRKWIHRQVSRRFLPKNIVARKKRGFAVDIVDGWFRGAVGGDMKEVLMSEDSLMYDFLRPGAVQHLLAQHQLGRTDNHKVLFSLVVFEHWMRQLRATPLDASGCMTGAGTRR
jgi:asparagine synthase (glutamine-hydrolysing)